MIGHLSMQHGAINMQNEKKKELSQFPAILALCYITWYIQTLEDTEHNFSGTKKIIKEMRKRKKKKKMMIWKMMTLNTVSEIYSNTVWTVWATFHYFQTSMLNLISFTDIKNTSINS